MNKKYLKKIYKQVLIGLFLVLLAMYFMLREKKVDVFDFFDGAYKEIQTDSGFKVLFVRDESLPFIQYRIFFPHAGADYSLESQSGLSNMTAYLMDQGAGGLSSSALQEELNQLGTGLSIEIGRQTSELALEGLSWHGKLLWDFFKKIVAEPHFSEQEFKILQQQMLEQRLKRLDNPSSVANFMFRQQLFKGAIGYSQFGTLNSLLNLSLEDVKKFYKDNYIEGNPILMVIGQYDEILQNHILSFLDESFSYKGTEPPRFSIEDLAPTFNLLTNEALIQTEVRLGYPIESFPVDTPKRYLALKLANSVLGSGSMNARLFQELREKRGLTYGVSSHFSQGKSYGYFTVSGNTKVSSVKEFLEQALRVLKDFRKTGVSSDDLKRVKKNIKSRYLKSTERLENKLSQFVFYKHFLGVDSYFLTNYLDVLESVSLKEVNQAIEEFILSKPLNVLVYGPSSLQNQLKGFKDLPPLQTISFKEYFKEELKIKSQVLKNK